GAVKLINIDDPYAQHRQTAGFRDRHVQVQGDWRSGELFGADAVERAENEILPGAGIAVDGVRQDHGLNDGRRMAKFFDGHRDSLPERTLALLQLDLSSPALPSRGPRGGGNPDSPFQVRRIQLSFSL